MASTTTTSSTSTSSSSTSATNYAPLPELLQRNLPLLSEDDKSFVARLCELDQGHLFAYWKQPGEDDGQKLALVKKLRELDQGVVGGLEGYITRAKKLLLSAKNGENPFDGWRPEIPHGVNLVPFSEDYARYETIGMPHIASCGFVLVAGGLGERLGFKGIKIELPVETVTRTCYLEHYCQQFLAMQARYATPGHLIPLAIMVSDDTHDKTVDLLERNNYFGMRREQLTLMKQGEVPALISNDAQIAMQAPYIIEAKPHGHGDVHSLMHSTGTAQRWFANGVRYVVFFQDTNALAFHTLPAMLGVSLDLQLEVNSLAIPRFAKQAVGAITKLVHEDGRTMTINVEYNQLDPLLRSTISPQGDVNDATGHSPFPGNINQLLFALEPYIKVLEQTKGLMPEFVNPKYKDATRTVFKKPTRLECMMQDYPKLLPQGAKVGFTNAPDWLCYSPCKNNPTDAAASIASGVPAAAPYTAECDQYRVYAQLLRCMGAKVEEESVKTVLGIPGVPGPRLVVAPSTAVFPHEFTKVFPNPSNIQISARSSLVLKGDVEVNSLQLDGGLQVSAELNSKVSVQQVVVHNAGHEMRVLEGENLTNAPEIDRMRGYMIDVVELQKIEGGQGKTWVYTGQALVPAETLEEEASTSVTSSTSSANPIGSGSQQPDLCCAWLGCF
jgi:UDP-sugar pyrophosphorylase